MVRMNLDLRGASRLFDRFRRDFPAVVAASTNDTVKDVRLAVIANQVQDGLAGRRPSFLRAALRISFATPAHPTSSLYVDIAKQKFVFSDKMLAQLIKGGLRPTRHGISAVPLGARPHKSDVTSPSMWPSSILSRFPKAAFVLRKGSRYAGGPLLPGDLIVLRKSKRARKRRAARGEVSTVPGHDRDLVLLWLVPRRPVQLKTRTWNPLPTIHAAAARFPEHFARRARAAGWR